MSPPPPPQRCSTIIILHHHHYYQRRRLLPSPPKSPASPSHHHHHFHHHKPSTPRHYTYQHIFSRYNFYFYLEDGWKERRKRKYNSKEIKRWSLKGLERIRKGKISEAWKLGGQKQTTAKYMKSQGIKGSIHGRRDDLTPEQETCHVGKREKGRREAARDRCWCRVWPVNQDGVVRLMPNWCLRRSVKQGGKGAKENKWIKKQRPTVNK